MSLIHFISHYSYFLILLCLTFLSSAEVDPKLTKVWGPGLRPDLITLPARYMFFHAVDKNNNSYTSSLGKAFTASVEGDTKDARSCRIWTNVLDKKDGSYIIRYKLYEHCYNLRINIKYEGHHVADSPYKINGEVHSENCNCPKSTLDDLLQDWNCQLPNQIIEDLKHFSNVDWDIIRNKVISHYNTPHSVSLCHYVIKDNEVYRKCYGQHVGFKMFMDSTLLSLTRKVRLPDLEFFVNLGDWPLASHNLKEKYPIFSWCGSEDTYDIVMPTYDITQSSLECMGSVMLDMLSVQGNVAEVWENRIPKMFWRGRDSNVRRLDLIKIARNHPDLFNASLTNFFFFRDKEPIYGPKEDHVSFFSFFDYKYQIGMDGTVAPYRLPYLLGGGSLLFKPPSKYYEHFYHELEPNVHYIPVKEDLSDLVDKIKWAIDNDDKAKKISKTGQDFANRNLLPSDILCYYTRLLYEFKKIITSKVEVLRDMEKVERKDEGNCDCSDKIKDEL